MPSTSETILRKLTDLLETYCTAKVERNTVMPEKIPPAGLIIIRDGDPGEPEYTLGGFDPVYYTHTIPIELYIEDAHTNHRDNKFDDLVIAVGNVLGTYPTLDDLVFGIAYGRPEVEVEPVLGGPAIKSGTINLITEYEASSALA